MTEILQGKVANAFFITVSSSCLHVWGIRRKKFWGSVQPALIEMSCMAAVQEVCETSPLQNYLSDSNKAQ